MPIINKKFLTTLAKSVAAALYVKFVNRYEGNVISEFEKLELNGTISSVTHTVGTDGRPGTQLSFGKDIVGPNFINFLDPGTRAFILQQVKGEQR